MKSKKIGGELAFAGSLLILGLVVLYDTSKMLVPPGSGTVGPQVFPYLVSGFVIFISLGLFVQIFRGNLGIPEGTEFGEVVEKTDFKSLAMVAGSMLTYPLLIERAGFIIASSVVFFGVAFAYGAKNLLKNLAISVIFSLIVYFAFSKGLNVSLPAGILGVFE
ncbi:MAG: tripartite tricarboxylate transporter TctB family protein [Actinobacteria bacterium]|nr:tripartite tricarboxylate transporter TctB family protein [Actinomycetota bacterium]